MGAASPWDSQGRRKLMSGFSRGSRVLIFFVMMWRSMMLYEHADKLLRGLTRLIAVTMMSLLFVGNLSGLVISVMAGPKSSKKRLKAILNLNKLQEIIIIIYAFGRLSLFPSQYTPREIYIATILHCMFFLGNNFGCTRLVW